MQAARDHSANQTAPTADRTREPFLTTQELLAGGLLEHNIVIPAAVLHPGDPHNDAEPSRVRLRPLKIATLALISKAAREDASLVPLLMIKESLAEPALGLDQIRQMHAGLVHFLVAAINRISGLDPDDTAAHRAFTSAIGDAHIRLAWYYGWTPSQVAELTPGQVTAYLAGIERLLAHQTERRSNA